MKLFNTFLTVAFMACITSLPTASAASATPNPKALTDIAFENAPKFVWDYIHFLSDLGKLEFSLEKTCIQERQDLQKEIFAVSFFGIDSAAEKVDHSDRFSDLFSQDCKKIVSSREYTGRDQLAGHLGFIKQHRMPCWTVQLLRVTHGKDDNQCQIQFKIEAPNRKVRSFTQILTIDENGCIQEIHTI